MNEVSKQLAQQASSQRLQDAMAELPQVECPVRNHFAPGIYMREMTIPAGTCVVGAVHKTEHLSILSKGILHITTEEGVIEMVAPYTLHSYPGIKRAVYAVTDCVFTTIHPTTETDLDKLCELLTDTTSDQLLGGKNNVQALANQRAKELT